MKIKKGDKVIILTGKDKGKSGKVLLALPKDGKVIVEKINLVKKNFKNKVTKNKGEIIEKEMPLNVSNVSLIDSNDNKPTRVGYKVEGGKKIRIAKRTGTKI
jgi:large subunit ribosomal protein L24